MHLVHTENLFLRKIPTSSSRLNIYVYLYYMYDMVS